MKSLPLAALATLLFLPAHAMPPAQGSGAAPGKPAGHPTASGMPSPAIASSDGQQIVWSCTAGQLGSLPVKVNFADKKALSARASKMNDAKVAGDVVTWTEAQSDATYTLAFVLNRKTGDLQVTQTPQKGQAVVHKGKCKTPESKRQGG